MEASFNGFLGTYRYTIKSGDRIRSGTFDIEHSSHSDNSNRIVLSLDSAIPDHVRIIQANPDISVRAN